MCSSDLGGTAPAILNAANEAAVAAFLDGRIRFLDICLLTARALTSVLITSADSLSSILDADAATRAWVEENIVPRASGAPPDASSGVSL